MKKVKQFLVFMIVMIMAVSISACGTDSKETTEKETKESKAEEVTTEETTDEDSTEEDSKEETTAEESNDGETKKLIMGTSADFAPYEYYENDEIVGIDAEVAQAIADKLGYELEIVDMDFSSILVALTSGKINMGIAAFTVTEERQKSVDFSDSYGVSTQVVIVKQGSDIIELEDLKEGNYTIAVQLSSIGDSYVTDDLEAEGLCTVDRYNKATDTAAALTTGKAEAVVIDQEVARILVSSNEGLMILDEVYAIDEYAITLAKDSPLTEEINGALEELKADGTLQSIFDKYLTTEQ